MKSTIVKGMTDRELLEYARSDEYLRKRALKMYKEAKKARRHAIFWNTYLHISIMLVTWTFPLDSAEKFVVNVATLIMFISATYALWQWRTAVVKDELRRLDRWLI